MSACSTGSLIVQSSPDGAEVFAVRSGTQPVKLGKTPLTLTRETSPELMMDNLQLNVSKDGFASQSVLIHKAALGSNISVNVDLKEGQGACTNQEQALSDIGQSVAEIQHMVFRKNYGESRQALQAVMAKYPKVAILYTLMGNIRYLEKDLPSALEAYRRAKELQPNNAETARMIEKITTIHSGSSRSSPQ